MKRTEDKKVKKPAVLYHGGCEDGMTGAFAAWKKFGKRAEYFACFNREEIPKEVTERKYNEVYLIDYSFIKERMEWLRDSGIKVIFIDHHVSAEKYKDFFTENVFDLTHSGAGLAFPYFHPKKTVPRFVKVVQDGDLWKGKYVEEAKFLHFYLKTQKWDFATWDKIARQYERAEGRKKIVAQGKYLYGFQEKILDDLLLEAYPISFEGVKGWAVNAPHFFASRLGERLYEKYGGIAIIYFDFKDQIGVSLRAKADGKIDVAKIAEKYNGGGHPAAAGFRLLRGRPLPWKHL
ncbi:MAG: hypothetical protein FJY91_01410 [Candidatus Harrisonbacteria bacterium]|nr:hypothetical protein [Candidatus Harrisonbacteria bacterium]